MLSLDLQHGAVPGRPERLLLVEHDQRGAEDRMSRGGRPSLLPVTSSSILSGRK